MGVPERSPSAGGRRGIESLVCDWTRAVSPACPACSGDYDDDDDYDEDGLSTDGGGSIGSAPGIIGDGIGSDDDEESESSSEADSVFGSDLDVDDEDLGSMRKKAGRGGGGPRFVRGGFEIGGGARVAAD